MRRPAKERHISLHRGREPPGKGILVAGNLREKLRSKGYTIVDEFACKGFNTNSFMKYLGGMNKGRPNDEDLKNAEEFAENLKKME